LCVVVFIAGIALPACAADNPVPELYLPSIRSLDPAAGSPATDPVNENVRVQLSALPLTFIPNRGQYDPAVVYMVAGPQSTLFFTHDEIVITAREGVDDQPVEHIIRQTFPGSAESPVIEGADLLPGVANYFTGNDPSRWQSNVPTYGSVLYRNLYPGIDLRYKGTEGILKREFVVEPGADPAALRLHYNGIDTMTVDDAGALILTTGNSTLTESPVICYQEIDGRRIIIPAGYHPAGDRDITFAIGTYDPSFPLVIDPALVYSTYLGSIGLDDSGHGIAVDSEGNAYVIGQTYSHIFPTTVGAYNRTFGGGSVDAFVTKLNPSGSALVYSTYLGGTHSDFGYGIAVDSSGNAYVTGDTLSSDFPTTAGAYKRIKNVYGDAFVTKLNPSGSALVYSTYLGGLEYDFGRAIAVDSGGNAYMTGYTLGSDFPTTEGAYNRTYGGSYDAFVTKLNPSGSSLVYSTYLAGVSDDFGHGIAVDTSGNAYVTGQTWSSDFPTTAGAYNRTFGEYSGDAFVSKLNPMGSSLVYSTYLGGFDYENGHGIAVDSSGNAYVTGDTESPDFPTTVGAYNRIYGGTFFDAFVTKLNPAGSALVYSTYLGGLFDPGGVASATDHGNGIAVDNSGNAYVTGQTYSSNFPTTSGAYNQTFGGYNGGDAFVTKLNPAGSSLLYSTYLGGASIDSGNSIALDSSGNAYVTGNTGSSDFPTTVGAYNRIKDVYGVAVIFVAKLSTMTSQTSGSDIGVFRPLTHLFYLDYNGNGVWNGATVDRSYNFGITGDIPVTGDWNSDGRTEIGVFRNSTHLFYLDYNGNGVWNGSVYDRQYNFGISGDIPVSGDWNSDGRTEIGVFRNSTHLFYLDYNGNGVWNGAVTDRQYNFGISGDIPVSGDWNLDGRTEIGVFRPSTHQFYLDYNGNGVWNGAAIDRQYNFGIAGDIPVSGDWNADGTTEIGVFRPSTHIFYLDYSGNGMWNGGGVDRQYNFGITGDKPVSGKW